MLKRFEVFETSDGKRFDNEAKALEHIADAAREILDARLAPLMAAGKLSANDRYRVVLAIIPDANAAKALWMQLARMMDY